MSPVLRLRNHGLNETITGCFWIGLWDIFFLVVEKRKFYLFQIFNMGRLFISLKQMDKHTQKLKRLKSKQYDHQPWVVSLPDSRYQRRHASGLLQSESGLAAEGAWALWSERPLKTLPSKHSGVPVNHLPVALLCSLRFSCVLILEWVKWKNKLFVFL